MSRESDPQSVIEQEPTITLFRVALYTIGAILLAFKNYELLVLQFCFGVLFLTTKVAIDYLESSEQ